MMKQAGQEESIPQECFAKKHSHCNYAVLTKQFFCDSSRSLHYPAGLGECDFGDCYDRAAHPPTRIAQQSWGIPGICNSYSSHIYANNAICVENRIRGVHRDLWWNKYFA
jgi:hypothetical protein